MPVTLEPTDVTGYGLQASAVDIADAANIIHAETLYTPDEHVDTRNIPAGNVRRAWAIVADRLRRSTAGDADRHVTSETQGDYSRTAPDSARPYNEGLLAGRPWELLELPKHLWATSGHDTNRAALGFYDDHGVYFPPNNPVH